MRKVKPILTFKDMYVINGHQGPPMPSRDGLIGEWMLNGNLLDTSGFNMSGVNYGATFENDYLSFDGVDDYVDGFNRLIFVNYTLSLVISLDELINVINYISGGGINLLGIAYRTDTNRLYLIHESNDVLLPSFFINPPTFSGFTSIIIEKTSNTNYRYLIDGVEIGTTTISSRDQFTNALFGKRSAVPSFPTKCKMKKIRIYNRLLSSSELSILANDR